MNVIATIFPFYLQEVLGYKGTEANPTPPQLAAVPLVAYICSTIFSIFV